MQGNPQQRMLGLCKFSFLYPGNTFDTESNAMKGILNPDFNEVPS
jgi:hypothetical protein